MGHTATINRTDDIDLITDDIVRISKAHKRKLANKVVKVRSTVEKALDDYREAKAEHKSEIAKLKAEDKLRHKVAKNNIKAHKNLMKSAKTTYVAVKLAEQAK